MQAVLNGRIIRVLIYMYIYCESYTINVLFAINSNWNVKMETLGVFTTALFPLIATM